MSKIIPSLKATVSSRGQLVIPKEVRDACGIVTGTEVLIRTRDDGVIEIKLLKRNVADLFQDHPRTARVDVDEAIAAAVLDNDERTKSRSP